MAKLPEKCKLPEILTRSLSKIVKSQLIFALSARKKSKFPKIFTRITNFGWSGEDG